LDAALALAKELIARRSVTPEDGGCQDLIAERLAALGFRCEPMRFGAVANLWARRGTASPHLCFAGHTDVVPTGPLDQWLSDPFVPTLRDNRLYGRGAADMKSSIAAFVVALEAFVAERPKHSGSVSLLITSDEEGPSVDGTARVVEALKRRGERVDWCLVGEPTSEEALGDTIKNGRRGSLNGRLTVRGVQGHIAYPQLARNPIHQLAPALAELAATEWDRGNEYFQPTSWQVSNIHAGTGATNMIPAEAVVDFNFRFSPASSEQALKERFEAVLKRHQLDCAVDWARASGSFMSRPGKLAEVLSSVVEKHTGRAPRLSTSGGTSDGRFIVSLCPEVVELGPPNQSIHKLNEHIELAALEQLPRIYLDVLRVLLP
jgi:succinyl-diaminopimelate desuccinylase